MKIILCDEEMPQVSIFITAAVEKETGLDIAVLEQENEDFPGSLGREFHYHLHVEPQYLDKLTEALMVSSRLTRLEELLLARFSGINGLARIQAFCEEAQVPFSCEAPEL